MIKKNEKSNTEKKKLNAMARPFDVSPTLDPYQGEFGIQTRPAQIPPAKIPTHTYGQKVMVDTLKSRYQQVQHVITTPNNPNLTLNPPRMNGTSQNYQQNQLKNYDYVPIQGNNQNFTGNNNYLMQQRYINNMGNINMKNMNMNHINNNMNGMKMNMNGMNINKDINGKNKRYQDAPGTARMADGRISINESKIPFGAQTSHKYAKTIGVSVNFKHHNRPYHHKPNPEEIDPKFTNDIELRSWQHWELLESAKRWLPGEGTYITWKGYKYLIGPPIHMGMNGHIHYCYKYKIPKNHNSKIPPNVQTVAAKIVPNTPAFAREIVILRALQECENVAQLFEVIESDRTLISILELAQADVYNFFVGRVSSKHGWNLNKPAVREHFGRMVISNVVQGLDQMQSKKYLHCDLKSLNILLYIYVTDHSNRRGGVYLKAKLTDFGHSSHGEGRIAEKLFPNGMARVGTAGHIAPELFMEGTKCNFKIDIWSLGIVMFSMLVPGRLLFGEYMDLDTLKRGYNRVNKMNPWSRDRPSWWNDFERLSPEARDLILLLTRFDPKERPNCQKILQHPWFLINKKPQKGTYKPRLKFNDMICASSIAQE